MRSLREVASGIGMLGDLARPVAQVRLTRVEDGAGGGGEEDADARALLAAALGDDAGAAARAMAALVERVVVGSDSVNVAMRVVL